jgi:hypothetical protein
LLTSELCALARDQLGMQTARSGTLNAGALAVMAIDAALAIFVIDTSGADGLWIAALALLGLSFALAIRALRLTDVKETGPSVARLREDRETHDDHRLTESLLEDLATDIQLNDRILARTATLFNRALITLVLAILIDLAGRL